MEDIETSAQRGGDGRERIRRFRENINVYHSANLFYRDRQAGPECVAIARHHLVAPDKEVTDMRLGIKRMLLVGVAVVGMSLPVASMQKASACDVNTLNNCSGTTTVTGIGDTVTSPFTYTVGAPAFQEVQLMGQGNYTVTGTLGMVMQDERGNNEGFVVQLEALGGAAAGSNVVIPPDDYYVNNSVAADGFCGISAVGGDCEVLHGYTFPAPGASLAAPVTIGCAPALQNGAEGYGTYALQANLTLIVPDTQHPLNEIFGTNPKSWFHAFTVNFLQGPSAALALGEPANQYLTC
jgi:hypothetical protein